MTAVQGQNPWEVTRVFGAYLETILQLQSRYVRMWWGTTRPQIAGSDFFAWYRLATDKPSKAQGQGRWGNRTDLKIEVHWVARQFADESQVDERRAKDFYEGYFKLEQSLQNLNLFDKYAAPLVPPSGEINDWFPPQPLPDAIPYTIEPMYLEDLPAPTKTQKEEGTPEVAFMVILPTVLRLTVPS